MSGGWVACLGLVLLAHYCCSNADHIQPSKPAISSERAVTPTLPTKTGEPSKRGRNINPFMPFFSHDPNEPDFSRNMPPVNPSAFLNFNPFMYMLMTMMMNPQNPFNMDILRGAGMAPIPRTVITTSVIQSTITETITQTSITPFIETTTIVIPSTSTSTIVVPVYTTEMFVVTATSTSTIVVPEYSTTTILAYTGNQNYQQNLRGAPEDEYFEERRNNRQARVPNNFKTKN